MTIDNAVNQPRESREQTMRPALACLGRGATDAISRGFQPPDARGAMVSVAERRLKRGTWRGGIKRRSATRALDGAWVPGVETPGNLRASLCDAYAIGCARWEKGDGATMGRRAATLEKNQ